MFYQGKKCCIFTSNSSFLRLFRRVLRMRRNQLKMTWMGSLTHRFKDSTNTRQKCMGLPNISHHSESIKSFSTDSIYEVAGASVQNLFPTNSEIKSKYLQ